MRSGWRILLILAGVWLVAAAVVWTVRAHRPTPEAVQEYIAKHPLEGRAPSERKEIIGHVAGQLNRLDFEERQKVRSARLDKSFYQGMTPEERNSFLDQTLPQGFHQLMEALNKMDPQKRQKVVQRALEDLQKDDPQAAERMQDPEAKKFISKGLESFYSDASADVKLECAPLIEQLQRNATSIR